MSQIFLVYLVQTVTEYSDADLHLLGGEGVLAQVQRLELMVGL